MRYAYIGLGNLGGHLAMSLVRNGFDVVVHDLDRGYAMPNATSRLELLGPPPPPKPQAPPITSSRVFRLRPLLKKSSHKFFPR
jgi:NAD binding domain of 6-phosphogluconate dehydrogenase